MYTGKQQNLEQPKFCSSFIDKIWSHKRSPEVRDRGKSPEKNKTKNNEKSDFEKGSKKSEIKLIASKLKRVTNTLPFALQSTEAYGPGDTRCEVCSMTREKYKSDLHSAKVVGILVDGVVEKEQTEKMDEENEPEELDEGKNMLSKDNGKGDKISFNISVYCERDVIKHNLKCILIKLQKTLGDIMVQICFVKTRKLCNEEKYRKFNVSISDLKLLKYEYTNLTDAIVPLFKSPLANRKSNTEVCVACVKEKLCEYNVRLGEILKSGRNLRVVMRNDGDSHGTDKCCPRDYPHVHAEVQGKPIVLKYSLPFQVKASSKSDKPSNENMQTDPSGRPYSYQNIVREQNEEVQPTNQQDQVPYYEWPEDFSNQENEFEQSDNSPLPVPIERKPLSDSESLDSLEDNLKVPKNVPPTALQPSDEFHSPKPKSATEASVQSISFKTSSISSTLQPRDDFNTPNHKSATEPSVTSISFKTSSISSTSGRPETKMQTTAPVELKTSSNSHRKTGPPHKSKENVSTTEDSDSSGSDNTSTKSKRSKQSSLYCGCNYDNAFQKLGTDPEATSKSTTDEDNLTTDSESSPSFLSDKPDEEKKVNFPFKLDNTTAFPVTTTQLSNLVSKGHLLPDPHLEQSSTKNTNDVGKISSAEHIDDNNIDVHLVSRVDSLVLTKERLSQGGDPYKSLLKLSVSPEDKAVAAAFKSFIDEPEYEIRRVVTTDGNSMNPHQGINQPHKKLDLLTHFGRDNLLSVCSPADCCKINNDLENKTSFSDLPLSPSLNSLPLDQSDLEYLAEATGTPISYEDIMLLAREEVSAKNEEWEIHYADNKNDQYKARWLRAVDETEERNATCNNAPTTTPRRSGVKSVVIKEEPRLSTIVEESPFCLSEDENPSIPYMPSIPSLPLDKDEKAELIKKRRPSILKHTTMELRYFTVEFPDVNNEQKKQKCSTKIQKPNNNGALEYNKICLEGRTGNETSEAVKTKALLKSEVNKKSCDSFHSCSSSTEVMNVNYDQIKSNSLSSAGEQALQRRTDEETMFNAIYLCDNNFDYNKNINTSKTMSKNSGPDIVHFTDIAKSKTPNFSERETSYITCIPEINDCYVKNLISAENRTQNAAINKSYTIIRNTESEIACLEDKVSQTNSIKSFANFDKSDITLIRSKNKQQKRKANNSIASINSLKDCSKNNVSIHLNIKDKETSDSKIISINNSTPKYISVKLNQSYTIVKDTKQYMNNKSGFSYKIDSKPQTSYTVITEKEIGRTTPTTERMVQKEPILINYSTKQNVSKTPTASLNLKTKNSSPNSRGKQSNWSKLKLDQSNVKKYVNEQKNYKQITSINKTNMKHLRDPKRKPLILPQSGLSFRRMQSKVALPRTYFSNLHPILVNFQIPLITFVPNNVTKNRYEGIKESHKLQQQSGDTKKTQNLSTLLNKEKTCKNELKEEPEQIVVQQIENNFNFKVANPVTGVRRNLNKSKYNQTSNNAKTEEVYSNSLKTQSFESKKSFPFVTVESTKDFKCSQLKVEDCKIDEHLLMDADNNPLYLFDCHGRPLTDQSGRTLRTIHGKFLIKFDGENNPVCDLDNNPICDSLGHILNKRGFSSVKPAVEDVLKSFVKDSGDPILLYDIEGRPLTSISGTMLVDAAGKSLIRFACTDKISDSLGKPIFDSNGEYFNGIG